MAQHSILSRKTARNNESKSRFASGNPMAISSSAGKAKGRSRRQQAWWIVVAVVVVAIVASRANQESSFLSSSFLMIDKEIQQYRRSSQWSEVSANTPSFSAGCKVCDKPDEFSFGQALENEVNINNNQTTMLWCQSFWHKKYPSWDTCRQAAIETRIQFRKKLCEICRDWKEKATMSSSTAPLPSPSTGVVYAISGISTKYFQQAKRGIRVLRSSHVQYNGTVQVFVDSEQGQKLCEDTINANNALHANCLLLSRTFTVGYNAKLAAALETDLDNVIMIDTDNILIQHPHKVLKATQRVHGDHNMILFPDLWGHDCQQFYWAKADDNPTGVMLAGQSGWESHVVWPTVDVNWQPNRQFSQETGNTITVIQKRDKRLHGGIRAAYELAFWMTERLFFQNVLFGEKDALRVALLTLNVPFVMVDEMPYELVTRDGLSRYHLMAVLDGTPITFDLVKGSTKNCCAQTADLIVKVRPSAGTPVANAFRQNKAGSFCIHSSYGGPSKNREDPRLEIHNATQDPIARQWLDRLSAIDKEDL